MQETPLWVDKYKKQLAILNDVIKWELIRKWSLSEVWRIHLKNGEALILKKGSKENSREVNIYEDLLIPLEVNIPNVYKTYKHHAIGIVIMEEKKGMTLEKEPLYEGFIQATKELSVLRSNATSGITQGKISNCTNKMYYMKKEDILRDLTYISTKKNYLEQNERAFLTDLLNGLPKQLTKLYNHFPLTLTHHDYHPKNLIYHNGEVVIIDWAYAYLSPHLGDLYCLIQSAKDYNIPSRDLIEAYCEGLDKRLVIDIEWQIKIGGICWAIYVLRNLIDFGIDAIPDAKEWLSDLVSDIRNLMSDIE